MKHAYLVMAHNEPYILEKLLKLLDYEDNDIYLHIDKKSKVFDFEEIKSWVKKSNLYFVKRLDVRWGTNSQVKCELELLESALKNEEYGYIHLLSGVDLPLKNQKEIHSFFDKNNGKEFIHYYSHNSIKDHRIERVKYYHLFNKELRSSSPLKNKITKKIYYNLLRLQRILRINRIKNREENYYFGAQWFSITGDLAKYILANKRQILKDYRWTFCTDEIFIQSLVYGTKYYDNLYMKKDNDFGQVMRRIDWERGLPYTFKSDDYEELMNSGMLFARKFSTSIDKQIIDKIYERVSD